MGLLRLALSFLLGPPVFLAAALCAGAAAAAQQGKSSLRWDLLAQFAPIWFAGALACAVVAFIALRGVSRLLILSMGIAGMIFAGMLMAPEFTRSTGPEAGPGAPGALKIIQFNVWSHNAEPDQTVDWIVAQQPDIVILEETTPALRRLIEARTHWRSACRDCEVMIYSRLPMRAAPTPKPPAPAPGPLTHAVVEGPGGDIDVVGVHYAWPTDGGDQQKQEARLAEVIDALPRSRTIVTGDFNSTPWSFYRRKWDARFGLIRRDRALFSWPAGKFTQRRVRLPVAILPIDHIYAGADWATVSVTRGPKLGSDHYPVVAILAPAAAR